MPRIFARAHGIFKLFQKSPNANRRRLSSRRVILDSVGQLQGPGVDSEVFEDGVAVFTPFQMVVFFVIQFAIATHKCPDTGCLHVFEFEDRRFYVNPCIRHTSLFATRIPISTERVWDTQLALRVH